MICGSTWCASNMDDRNAPRQLRGLYKRVNISVPTLNRIITLGLAVLVLAIVWAIHTGGYHVTFDSQGGTDVPYQALRYGDTVAQPEPPTREGYRFEGWYQDEGCNLPWDFSENLVSGDLTLYAKWAPLAP